MLHEHRHIFLAQRLEPSFLCVNRAAVYPATDSVVTPEHSPLPTPRRPVAGSLPTAAAPSITEATPPQPTIQDMASQTVKLLRTESRQLDVGRGAMWETANPSQWVLQALQRLVAEEPLVEELLKVARRSLSEEVVRIAKVSERSCMGKGAHVMSWILVPTTIVCKRCQRLGSVPMKKPL
jgi:hypothetical protein